jgi:hypothetical protein
MIHYGAAGVFGGPRQERREPDADCFRVGDVWQNSRGTDFRVVRVEGRIAYMVNMTSGRTHSRPWGHIGAHTGRQWVRLSCGA